MTGTGGSSCDLVDAIDASLDKAYGVLFKAPRTESLGILMVFWELLVVFVSEGVYGSGVGNALTQRPGGIADGKLSLLPPMRSVGTNRYY